MKKSFLIIGMITLAIMALLLLSQTAKFEAQAPKEKTSPVPITIYQATDLHYLSSKLTDGGAFFTKIVDDGDGKVMHYSEDLMKAFFEQVIAEKPDVLLLTGDLTLNGEKISHEDLSVMLKNVEAAGVDVLVMPGNHDLNNGMAVHYIGDSYERVATVNAKVFSGIYRDFGYDQAISRDANSLSYVYQLNDNLRLLAVDVNSDDAPGQLKPETLTWVKAQLEKAKMDGVHVLSMTHQNMLQHNPLFSGGFVFEGSEALVSLYDTYGVLCNLSGHMHIQHVNQTAEGLTEAATSSLAITPNQYAAIKISESGLNYDTRPVHVEAYAKQHELKDPNLLNFQAYSEHYFKASSEKKLLSQIKLTPNAKAIAAYFSALNTAYFKGRGDTYPEDSKLLELPEVKVSFLSEYMRSIRLEPAKDHNHFNVHYNK